MTNTLRIERLSSTYVAARDHPSPLRLRSELDDIARTYILASCADAISPLLDPADPSVWIISSLQLNLLLDVHSAPPEDIARFWARGIASSVAQVLAAGADGALVLRFANRAAFLAHFLHKLAEERAFQHWYFSEFDSLRSLPRGSAIREALLREPVQIESVLLELDRNHSLAFILLALSRHDNHLIVACCSPGPPCTILSFLEILGSISIDAPSLSLIEIYLQIRRDYSNLKPSEAASAAGHLDHILQWVTDDSPQTVLDAVASGSLPGLFSDPPLRSTFDLLRIVATQHGLSALTPILSLVQKNIQLKPAQKYVTESGAVFLLLPVLLETPALLNLFIGPKLQNLLYLLFLTCVSGKISDAWRDPVVRLAAGLSELPALLDLSCAQLPLLPSALTDSILPEDLAYFFDNTGRGVLPGLELQPGTQESLIMCAALLLRAFARRLPALGGSSIEYLWRNVLSGNDRVVTVDEDITVHLQPRPLQIVLRMTSLHDQIFHLPWGSSSTLTLHFD